MARSYHLTLIAVLSLAIFATDMAAAQPAPGPARTRGIVSSPVLTAPTVRPAVVLPRICSEGRTASGQCINPLLGQWARRTAIVATQSKLSKSAGVPAAPHFDRFYRYPNALYADVKRDTDLDFGRRSTGHDYIPYLAHHGPGTAFPHSYPIPVHHHGSTHP